MAYNVTAQLNLQLNPQSINQIVQSLNSMTNGRSIGGNLFNVSKIKDVTNELNNSKNAMMQFGEQSGLAAKRFGAFTLVAGSLVQVTQGFRAMLNEAVAFDREMVKLKQVSSDTAGSGVAAIRQEIDKLSTGLGVSSSQLARVSVVLKQANLSLGETKTALEALALSALAPNFDSMEKTAEGAIAVLKQFKIPVEELTSALGSINAVAGEFAVEASDLIGVVQRTGGAFKAAGGNLNELLALFTSVRQTTRESAESISTGLRTIFTRIQRTGTAEALREVGVNLRYTRDEALALGNVNLTSQFVGAYEAVRRLSVALNQIPSTSPKFAQLVEELGGYRQISKVIPLIQEFEISQNALNVAITGGSSLMNSAAQAQGSFGNRLDKLKESYLQFGRSITDTSSFKTLFTAFETGAKSALVLLEAIKPLIPMLTVLATMKVAQSLGSFGAGFVKGIAPTKKSSGGLLHLKKGGIVPGSGSGDIVPAMLEPGEMVIPKKMVKKYSFGGPHTADIDEEALNNPSGFRSFMKGSTTINPKTGKYRKFFHGTKGQDFDYFSNAHARNTWFGRGHYFSADAKVASRYSETDATAGGYDPGARVMSTTLQMKNPYTWNSDKSLKDFMTKGGKKIKSINGQFDQKDWDEIVKKGVLPEDISQGTLDHLNKIFTKFPSIAKKWNQAYSEKIDKDGNKIIKGMSPESKMKFVAHGATQTLKKQGYDSVNVDYGLGKDYFNASTVFHPKQIKSLGNEGKWDPSLKEIGKNLGGYIHRQRFEFGSPGGVKKYYGNKNLNRTQNIKNHEVNFGDTYRSESVKNIIGSNPVRLQANVKAKFFRPKDDKENLIFENFKGSDKKSADAFEEFVEGKVQGTRSKSGIYPVDIIDAKPNNMVYEVKNTQDIVPEQEIFDKYVRYKLDTQQNFENKLIQASKNPNSILKLGKVGIAYNGKKISNQYDHEKTYETQKKASGGFIVPGVGDTDSVPMDLPVGSYVIKKSSTKKMGFANGGVVPAILTPGELVIDPKTASSIGRAKLDYMNRTGRSAFGKGGRVGFAAGGGASSSGSANTPEQNKALYNLYNKLPTLYQYLIDDLTKITFSLDESVSLEQNRNINVMRVASIYEQQMRLSLQQEELLKEGNKAEADKVKLQLEASKLETAKLMEGTSKSIQRGELKSGDKTIPIKYKNDTIEQALRNEAEKAAKKSQPSSVPAPKPPTGPAPSAPSSPPKINLGPTKIAKIDQEIANMYATLNGSNKIFAHNYARFIMALDKSVDIESAMVRSISLAKSESDKIAELKAKTHKFVQEGNKNEANNSRIKLDEKYKKFEEVKNLVSERNKAGYVPSGGVHYAIDRTAALPINKLTNMATIASLPTKPVPPPNRPTPTTPPTGPAPAPAPTPAPAPAPTPQPPTPTTPPTGPAPTPPKPPTPPTPPNPPQPPGPPPFLPPTYSAPSSDQVYQLARSRADNKLTKAGVDLKDTGNITTQVKLMEIQKQRAQIEREYIRHTELQIKEAMPHLKASERAALAQNMFADAMQNGTIAINALTGKVEGDTRLGGNGAQLMADKKAAQQAAKQPPPKESLLKRGINYFTSMPSENRMMMATMAGGMAASYGSEFFDQNAGTANDAVKNNNVGSYSLSKGAAGGLQGAAMAGSIAMSMGATPLVGAIAAIGVGVVSAIGSYIAANKQALEEVANANQEKLTALTTKMMEKQNIADLSSLTDSVSQLSTSAAKAASASTGILESLGLGGSFLGGRSEQKKRQDAVAASEKAQQQNAPQISNVLTKNLSQQLIKSGVVNKTEADFYKLSNTIINQSAEFQSLIMSARQTGESFEEARIRITKAASGIAQMEAVKQANLKMQDMINRSADHLKTFADNLEGASVRIGESFRNFDNAISAFEGGNRINKGYDLEKNAKIFANPSAFSSREFETAITSTFSNFPSEIGANIAQQYAPMADISNRLPEVLAQSIYAENPAEDFMSRMEAVLGDTAKDPQVKAILAGLANKLTDKDNIKTKGASALATEMSSSILDPIKAYGSKINELNNQITESLISSFTKLNQSTLKLIEGYEKADQLLFNALETQAKAQNIMMGGSGDIGAKPMAVAQLQAIQQKRYLDEAKRPELLGNTAGIGEALRTAMDNLNEIQQLPEEAFAGQDRSRAEVLAGFDKEIDSFKKALEHTITGQLAVAAEFGKLAQEVGKQRNAGASLSKRLAMGGPEEQLKFMQGSKIFQGVMSGQISAGQVLNNPMLAKMLDEFAQMTGEMKINGLTAQEHLNARIYEPHAQMAFGVPGRDVEANLVNQQALHEAEAAKAQQQLNESMQKSIENGNKALIASQTSLKQALDEVKMTEMIKLEQQRTVASPEMAKQQQAVNTIKSLNKNNTLNEQDLESLKDPSTRDRILRIQNLQQAQVGLKALSKINLNPLGNRQTGAASDMQANDADLHSATVGKIRTLLGGGNANNSILSPDEISRVIKKSFALKIPLNEVVKLMIKEKQGSLNEEINAEGGQNALRLTNTLNANPEFAKDFEGNLTKLSEAMANLGTTSFKNAAESVEKFAAIVKESTDNIEKMKQELKIMRESGKGVADTDKDKAAAGRDGVAIQNQENAARQMAQQQQQAEAARKAEGGVVGKANGGLIYKAVGGSIFKPRGTDTVPAMLTPGEFVMKKSAVDKIGALKLSQMNNNPSYFADGGPVDPISLPDRSKFIPAEIEADEILREHIDPKLSRDERQLLEKEYFFYSPWVKLRVIADMRRKLSKEQISDNASFNQVQIDQARWAEKNMGPLDKPEDELKRQEQRNKELRKYIEDNLYPSPAAQMKPPIQAAPAAPPVPVKPEAPAPAPEMKPPIQNDINPPFNKDEKQLLDELRADKNGKNLEQMMIQKYGMNKDQFRKKYGTIYKTPIFDNNFINRDWTRGIEQLDPNAGSDPKHIRPEDFDWDTGARLSDEDVKFAEAFGKMRGHHTLGELKQIAAYYGADAVYADKLYPQYRLDPKHLFENKITHNMANMLYLSPQERAQIAESNQDENTYARKKYDRYKNQEMDKIRKKYGITKEEFDERYPAPKNENEKPKREMTTNEFNAIFGENLSPEEKDKIYQLYGDMAVPKNEVDIGKGTFNGKPSLAAQRQRYQKERQYAWFREHDEDRDKASGPSPYVGGHQNEMRPSLYDQRFGNNNNNNNNNKMQPNLHDQRFGNNNNRVIDIPQGGIPKAKPITNGPAIDINTGGKLTDKEQKELIMRRNRNFFAGRGHLPEVGGYGGDSKHLTDPSYDDLPSNIGRAEEQVEELKRPAPKIIDPLQSAYKKALNNYHVDYSYKNKKGEKVTLFGDTHRTALENKYNKHQEELEKLKNKIRADLPNRNAEPPDPNNWFVKNKIPRDKALDVNEMMERNFLKWDLAAKIYTEIQVLDKAFANPKLLNNAEKLHLRRYIISLQRKHFALMNDPRGINNTFMNKSNANWNENNFGFEPVVPPLLPQGIPVIGRRSNYKPPEIQNKMNGGLIKPSYYAEGGNVNVSAENAVDLAVPKHVTMASESIMENASRAGPYASTVAKAGGWLGKFAKAIPFLGVGISAGKAVLNSKQEYENKRKEGASHEEAAAYVGTLHQSDMAGSLLGATFIGTPLSIAMDMTGVHEANAEIAGADARREVLDKKINPIIQKNREIERIGQEILKNNPDFQSGGKYDLYHDIYAEKQKNLAIFDKIVQSRISYKANGGSIFKPQGTDTVPAMLTPGEFVMRKAAVDKIGVTKLSQMNNSASYFANGGMVNGSSSLDQSTSFNQVAASFNGFIASFNVSVETFNNSIQIFGDKVNDFANAVSVMPSTLTVNGEVGASVVTNTAGIVTQISNVVQNMIASEIKKALNNNTSLDQKSRPS